MSNVEEYTKNFKFMIPDFNVATWHTEIKENFVAIDALIANFVQAQQFQGAWKQVTLYHVGDLVYISDKDSVKYGGLYKVLVEHTTDANDFDTYLSQHPEYYKLQGEMGAQEAALISQDWAIKDDGKVLINNAEIGYSAKAYAVGGVGTETNNAKYFKERADEYQQQAEFYQNEAHAFEEKAEQHAVQAMNFVNSAQNQAQIATEQAQLSNTYAQQSDSSAQTSQNFAQQAQQSAEDAEQEADRAERNASIQTYRNIGDIFFTTRIDTKLNGAVECNGGTYRVSDFTGEQAIGNLLALNKVPYVSLSEYQTAIDTNGSCRAFGWDGGDSFRVPTLNDVYIEAGTALTAGEFINESLPDHTHTVTFQAGTTDQSGFTGVDGTTSIASSISATSSKASGSTYQDGAKVKPDSVRYRAMVQLANEATDEALITATRVMQDVANLKQSRADVDAGNFSEIGKERIVGWGMPDYDSGVSIPSDDPTTFPINGYVSYIPGIGAATNAGAWNSCLIKINGKTVLSQSYLAGQNGTNADAFICPVGAGDTILVTDKTIGSVVFYPCKGEN